MSSIGKFTAVILYCEETRMSERVEYFDVLRGLAIFGVVAIHSSTPTLQLTSNSIDVDFTVLWRNLLNFAVPMFIVISGYFLARKKITHYSDYFCFLKKQIPRVYIPLFFWSLAWLGLAVLVQSKSTLDEVIKLLTFQSSVTYYFIALIIQYYLLLPFLRHFANKKGLLVSIAISLSMAGLIFYFRYFTNIELPVILYAGNFLTWGMFFILGLYLGSIDNIKISNKVLLISIFTFYTLSCIESYMLIEAFHRPVEAVSAVKVSSFLFSLALIVFLFKNLDLIKSNLLKKMGEMSFGIYLIHMFAFIGATKLLSMLFPSLQGLMVAYQFALIAIITLLSYLCVVLFNYIFSPKMSRLIGFR